RDATRWRHASASLEKTCRWKALRSIRGHGPIRRWNDLPRSSPRSMRKSVEAAARGFSVRNPLLERTLEDLSGGSVGCFEKKFGPDRGGPGQTFCKLTLHGGGANPAVNCVQRSGWGKGSGGCCLHCPRDGAPEQGRHAGVPEQARHGRREPLLPVRTRSRHHHACTQPPRLSVASRSVTPTGAGARGCRAPPRLSYRELQDQCSDKSLPPLCPASAQGVRASDPSAARSSSTSKGLGSPLYAQPFTRVPIPLARSWTEPARAARSACFPSVDMRFNSREKRAGSRERATSRASRLR